MIITLLRKPLDGSVVENTLKHSCGTINIDDTRVGNQIMVSRSMGSLGVMHDDNWESKPLAPTESTGRWPTNFVLIHKEGCDFKGTKKVKGVSASGGSSQSTFGSYREELKGKPRTTTGCADKDGKEEVADWDCVKGCPVKELDKQEGASRYFKQFKKEDY